MSGTLAAVVVIGIGIALVAVSVTMLSGMAETPGQQPRAATDVDLGPGGITVELEAVGDTETVFVQRNGELVRELADPEAGIQTVIEASNVSTGDTITVVGEADGNRVVLDSMTVDDQQLAADSGSSSGDASQSGDGTASGGVASLDAPGDIDGETTMPFDTAGANANDAGDSEDADGDSTVSVAWSVDDIDTRSIQADGPGPVVVGTEGGSVTAVNRSSGSRNWSASVATDAVSDLTRGDDAVYAGTDGGTIHRVDADTTNWSVDLGARLGGTGSVRVTGVEHAGGATYTTLSDVNATTPSAVVRTGPDGDIEWTSTDDVGRVTDLETTADGEAVVAETDQPTDEHRVRRVQENGTTDWEMTLPREPTAVRTDDGQVTVALAANETTSSSVWRLGDDGTPTWRYETESAANVTALAVDRNRTYVGFGPPNATLRAIDDTGTEQWQAPVPRGNESGGLSTLTDLRVGPAGDLYAGTPELTRLALAE